MHAPQQKKFLIHINNSMRGHTAEEESHLECFKGIFDDEINRKLLAFEAW